MNDVVVVGAAFAFSGAPASREALKGKVAAYDVITGELRWRFNTIPTQEESGSETWRGESHQYTGNAGVGAHERRSELGYVYLPVEAPTSDYYGGHRPGDNLYGQVWCVWMLPPASGFGIFKPFITLSGITTCRLRQC